MPVAIKGSGGGSVTLDASAAAADTTLTLPNTNGTVINTAPGTSGNVLTSTGSAWASTAPASTVATGTVIRSASSTTPSGYLKCDGSTYTSASYSSLATALGSLPVTRAAAPTTSSVSLYDNRCISYANSTVFMVPQTGFNGDKLLYSSDSGSTWTLTSTISVAVRIAFAPIWTGTYYVTASYDACDNFSVSYSTSPGSSYTTSSAPAGGMAVWTGNRLIFIQGQSYTVTNALSYSTGAPATLTSVTNFTAQTGMYSALCIAGGNNIAVVGGSTTNTSDKRFMLAAKFASSTDGATWTARTLPSNMTGGYIKFVSYTNSLFIAVDNFGNVASSSDGATWTAKGRLPVNSMADIIYISTTGYYYANGVYSSDLVTWNGLPVTPGADAFMFGGYASNGAWTGTKYVSCVYNRSPTAWTPFTYTTASQFIVPDFGGDALGASTTGSGGTYGAYNYIKT